MSAVKPSESRISQAEKEDIHDYLTLWYRSQWTTAHTDALVQEFAYVDGVQILEALRRHVHDQGKWPPKPADIEGQLTVMYQERQRTLQEQRQKALRKESDQTYRAAVLGDRAPRDERTRAWGEKIRAQVRKSTAVRRHLEARFHLDYRLPGDMKLLMQTLEEVDLAHQTLEEIEEAARELASKLGMELTGRLGFAEVQADVPEVSLHPRAGG